MKIVFLSTLFFTLSSSQVLIKNQYSLFYLIAHFESNNNNIKIDEIIINNVDTQGVMHKDTVSSKGMRPLTFAAATQAPRAVFIMLFKNGADPDFKESPKNSLFGFLKKPEPVFDSARWQMRKMLHQETWKNEHSYIIQVLENCWNENPAVKKRGLLWQKITSLQTEKKLG